MQFNLKILTIILSFIYLTDIAEPQSNIWEIFFFRLDQLLKIVIAETTSKIISEKKIIQKLRSALKIYSKFMVDSTQSFSFFVDPSWSFLAQQKFFNPDFF